MARNLARMEGAERQLLTAAVRKGTIDKEILNSAGAQGFDLIVMASHRPELSDDLIGPNAARVVRHSTCSVLVLRGT